MSLNALENMYHEGESYTDYFMTNREKDFEARHTATIIKFDFAEAPAMEAFVAEINFHTQAGDFHKAANLYLDIETNNTMSVISMRDTIITGPTKPKDPMTDAVAAQLLLKLADDFIEPSKSTDSIGLHYFPFEDQYSRVRERILTYSISSIELMFDFPMLSATFELNDENGYTEPLYFNLFEAYDDEGVYYLEAVITDIMLAPLEGTLLITNRLHRELSFNVCDHPHRWFRERQSTLRYVFLWFYDLFGLRDG